MMKFLVVLSLILLSHWCQELEASRQGSHGMKGEPGVYPSNCVDVERKMLELQQNQEVLVECVENCNYGRCVKVNNTYVCRCETAYSGRFCNEYSCDDQPCGNNSRCTGPNQCTCDDGYQLVNNQCCDSFSNCNDVSQCGITTSGIYNITVPGINRPVQVYCELNTNGGGWLVIQRRVDGNVDFDRDWADYQAGFGELNGNFWLGLDLMHAITSTESYQLRIDLEEYDGNTSYAVYRNFSVGNSQSNYTLALDGYSGNAGNVMKLHANLPFSTRDRDNDGDESTNCAVDEKSGWWHGRHICTTANLNGQYYNRDCHHDNGIYWYYLTTNSDGVWSGFSILPIKKVDMKIKLN